MAEEANRVEYGISNVHIWPIESTDASGVPTYGTVFAEPGAIEISLDAEGDSSPFYADNVVYYMCNSNNGYSGKLTIVKPSEAFREKILGELLDKNGVLIEDSTVVSKEFAMAFEFEGDAKKVRHLFYRCTATRPSVSSKTKEDKIDPNTSELKITAIPRIDNKHVKARCGEENDTAYSTWYATTPYVYVAPTP
jgi:phi13 family phage major tail protein